MDPFRMMLRTVSASLLLVLTFASASTTAHAQRLPTNARPTHYTLAMTPDIKNASFAGTETIDLVLAAPAKSITLNAIELKLLSVSANGQTGDVSYHTPDEQVVLTFPNALPAGSVALKIAFTGVLNDKLRGDRGAPGFSLLRRTGAEGDLRCKLDGRGGRYGDLEHEYRLRHARRTCRRAR
jgi:hypothetical protein